MTRAIFRSCRSFSLTSAPAHSSASPLMIVYGRSCDLTPCHHVCTSWSPFKSIRYQRLHSSYLKLQNIHASSLTRQASSWAAETSNHTRTQVHVHKLVFLCTRTHSYKHSNSVHLSLIYSSLLKLRK